MANEESIKIYDKELKKDLEMPFKDLLIEGTEITKNSIYMTEKYLSDKGFEFNFARDDYGIGGVELSYKNKIYFDKSRLEYRLKNKETREIIAKFLGENLYEIRANKIVYGTEKDTQSIDLSPRLHFIDTAYKELTGVDKYKYNIVNKQLQKFIYGYLTDDDTYLYSANGRRKRYSTNEEYNRDIKNGRKNFDDFKENFEIFISKMEYQIKLNKTKQEVLDSIIEDYSDKEFFSRVVIFIYVENREDITKLSDLEETIKFLSNEIKSFYENMANFMQDQERYKILKYNFRAVSFSGIFFPRRFIYKGL